MDAWWPLTNVILTYILNLQLSCNRELELKSHNKEMISWGT